MSMKQWEKKVLESPGADERVREIEDELRLAAGLTALREEAGLSQRQLAERIGVSQPRIVAIEHSQNVTIDVLDQYVQALGGHLEVSVVHGKQRTALLGPSTRGTVKHSTRTRPAAANKAAKSTSRTRRSA